jgi:hypothetical protein
MSNRLRRIAWAAFSLTVAFPLEGAAPCLGGRPYGPASLPGLTEKGLRCGPPIRLGGKSPDLGAGCLGLPDLCFSEE